MDAIPVTTPRGDFILCVGCRLDKYSSGGGYAHGYIRVLLDVYAQNEPYVVEILDWSWAGKSPTPTSEMLSKLRDDIVKQFEKYITNGSKSTVVDLRNIMKDAI